ncbi:hypothetical protein CTM76_01680 [Photobacterium phosphoreum]|uniref:hypothetical protein n=3 Tax=Photobacterium phosphoreum TaxID=659 RepID=UPI000D151B1C|nr:hypothetical protein [Photobacterium phosphoreum]PSU80011.1 hypothetical protein CTM76_01680 [Photobacterium phosphoreum]
MIQKLPLWLNEINELLIPSSDYRQQPHKSLNFRKHQEAEYLAQILWKLELSGCTLNRDVLFKLHSGEQKWLTEKGEIISIAEDEFEFEVLEKLGLIYFENGWVNLITTYLPEISLVDLTVKPVLRFLENIKNILGEKSEISNLAQLKLRISKDDFVEIVGDEGFKFLEHQVSITVDEEYYIVEVQGHGWDKEALLNEYFWNIFIKSQHLEEDIEQFYTLNALFPELIKFPHLKEYERSDSENFDQLIKATINDSFLLKCTIPEFLVLEESQRQFQDHLFIQSDDQNNSELETVSLSMLLERYERISSKDCNIMEYLVSLQGWSDYYRFMRSLAHCAIDQLAMNRVHLDYFDIYVSDILKELFDECDEFPLLKFYLLDGLHTDSINYDLYLISNHKYFSYSYDRFARRIIDKYRLHNDRYKDIVNSIVSLLAESYIATALNNDKKSELSAFLFDLINVRGVEFSQPNDIHQKLYLKIFELLPTSSLFDVIKKSIDHITSIRPDVIRKKSEMYILFLLLEIADRINKNEAKEKLKISLNKLIFSRYCYFFKRSLNNNGYILDRDAFYDKLAWEKVSESFCVEFLTLQPRKKDLYIKLSNDNVYNKLQYADGVSNYLQILNNLVKVNSTSRDAIISRIIDLVVDFGFENEEGVYPLACDFHSSTLKEEYSLLFAISKNFHHYRTADFERLLNQISNKAPLSSMLLLLENSQSESRKGFIQNLIDKRNYAGIDETNIVNIESSFNSAIVTNNLDLAKVALSQAYNFFENHRWKESINVKIMIFQWEVLKYKYDLITINNTSSSPEEKEKSINEIDIPLPNKNIENNHKTKSLEKEAKLFKSYIFGFINFNQNTERSIKIFEHLKKLNPNTIFPHLYFISKIKWLEANDSTNEEFYIAINEYESSVTNFNFEKLTKGNKADYLSAIYLSGQYVKVEQLCERLDFVDKLYNPIALTYCRTLLNNGNDNKAKQFIDDYKLYHGIDTLDEDFSKEVERVDESIISRLYESMSEKFKYQFITEPKNNDELRTIFNEIRLAKLNDLSEILPTKKLTKETFLYEEVLSCAKVIRSRVKNLEIEIKINDENLINSWIVSLFNSRLNLFGISIDEQKFIGESSPKDSLKTPKTSGSADGVIMDQRDEQIAVFEGLNLNSVSKSTVDSHYDKLAKYDLVGLSPMFLVSYCYFSADFSSSTDEYIKHVKENDYYDFERPDDHKIVKLSEANSKHLVAALEFRNRGKQSVAIYHILIDMKLPSQE